MHPGSLGLRSPPSHGGLPTRLTGPGDQVLRDALERLDHTCGTGLRPSAVGTYASRPQLKQLRAALGGSHPAGGGDDSPPSLRSFSWRPQTRGAIRKASAPPGRRRPPRWERCSPQALPAGSGPRPQGLDMPPDLPPRPAVRPSCSPDSRGAGRDPVTSWGGRA
ncbi:hypothetical protein NDU88_006252 [Pleurodeles waltl]|uniref:Uncharacterized protein n=1 Tax=Pleurodeles waltl TaxID=8319 RepID=A0AAV7SNY8_PLEWA|nr:hypothetical protein NDU88_006252 [Pleurodeles waltl]